MKKISVNNIILFRKKSEQSQKTFLQKLTRKSEIKTEGGGNYWVRSLSAMSKALKSNSTTPIKEKITEILELFNTKLSNQTKDMHQRNLEILHNYEDFDFSKWIPKNYQILSKTNHKSIIYIDTIPVQILPNQIYSYLNDGIESLGAIWFVAKLVQYTKEELGLFSEALYIYLTNNSDNKFNISPEYCLVVDVLYKKEVNYKMLLDGEITSILNSTLEEINKIR